METNASTEMTRMHAAAAEADKDYMLLLEDARWLHKQLRHGPLSHDFIRDERKCDICKRLKRVTARLYPEYAERR